MMHLANLAPPARAGHPHRAARWVLTGLLLLTAGAARAADPAPALRVCMDPDNPPFSSDAKTDLPGFYVELGRHLAQAVGRTFEPVWTLSYFGKRSVRTTLLDRKCDAYMGLPETKDFMGPRLAMSHPVLQLGYVLVLPPGLAVDSLSDLAGKRVAVQFASVPQSLIAMRDDITTVTVRETADAMQALKAGGADAAFIWGPTAGFLNKTALGGAYRIVPVAGPDMQWKAGIGFPRDQAALRDQVDAAIDASGEAIAALRVKYGFPSESEARLTLSEAAPAPAKTLLAAAGGTATDAQLAPEATPAAAGAAGSPQSADLVERGHELFNVNCSHCHGPDAIQAERKINLRRLQVKYGDRMDEVFHTTVKNGRLDKGMPSWDGVLSVEELESIKAYLHSVQPS